MKIIGDKKALKEVLRTKLYSKRVSDGHEKFHRDFSNGHDNRSREQSCDVIQESRQMLCCKILVTFHNNHED